jgi:HEAT repeat protein
VTREVHLTGAVSGVTRTERILASAPNRAVLPVLLAGLKSTQAEIRAATIRAAIRRHEHTTHELLIEHFNFLSETDRSALSDAHRAMPHHAAPSLKAAILKGDATRCKNACQIVALSGDVDLIPVLVKAVEDKNHHYRTDVAATILELATRVHQQLARWASGDRSLPHDPSFRRHHLLVSLEQSISRFAGHRRQEILDAFLLLAPVDNNTLNKILRDPNHPCHEPVITELTSSQDFGLIERLVEMLRDTDTPAAALRIISRRRDERFIDILLNALKRPVPVRVLHNMKSLTHVAWLEEHRALLLELDGRAQATAVELALASGLSRHSVFDLLEFLLRNGLTEARRACCRALAKFDSPQADAIVLEMLDDPDTGVQAAAVGQLRARRFPNALQQLVALLDSRAPEVRDAARSSLAEFNFTRYRTMFDVLDEDSARTTGVLVRKVDHSVQQKLAEELSSPSITTKLRGIEMAIAMEATNDLERQLIGLAHHENVAVRKEAVTALGYCRSDTVIAKLNSAAGDPNHSIAEAARQSLAKLLHRPSYVGNVSQAGETT